jgi:hypothetical protein
MAGVAAALIAILASAAVLLGISWSGRGDVRIDPAAEAANARYLSLVKQGHEHLRALSYPEAIRAFKEAERIAPEQKKGSIRSLVQTAEDRAAEYVKTLSRTEQIATHLADARIAMEDRRYADAVTAADAVLVLEATHGEATQIRAEAQKRMQRLAVPRTTPRPQATPGEQVATVTPQPVPSPTPEETSAPATGKARLRIALRSEVPEATVRIDLEGKRIFNHTFRGRRIGIRRRVELPFSDERTIELPVGVNDLQVLVVPGGKAGRTVMRSGNFPDGETRSLNVRVSDSGQVSVDLN